MTSGTQDCSGTAARGLHAPLHSKSRPWSACERFAAAKRAATAEPANPALEPLSVRGTRAAASAYSLGGILGNALGQHLGQLLVSALALPTQLPKRPPKSSPCVRH